jgi:hypothetical protein
VRGAVATAPSSEPCWEELAVVGVSNTDPSSSFARAAAILTGRGSCTAADAAADPAKYSAMLL